MTARPDRAALVYYRWYLAGLGFFRGGRCFSGHFPSASRGNSGDARDSKRVKMSECSFEALPREIQLRILREGLITVKGDTHPEPTEGQRLPWGPPPGFQVGFDPGTKSMTDYKLVPKAIMDGCHDVKLALQVACMSVSMKELIYTDLFEERLAALEKAVKERLWVPLEGKNPEYKYPNKTNLRGEPWVKVYDDDGKMRKELLRYIDPRHRDKDRWSALCTAQKYRLLLAHVALCCGRVWNMVNDDEVVFFEAFAPMILSHGSTFIDIWELLIGGVDNMSDLGATDNRERLHEAEERLSDLVTQFAQQNRM